MKIIKKLKKIALFVFAAIAFLAICMTAFYAFRPEGEFAASNNNASASSGDVRINIISWNIRNGRMSGNGVHGWPERKKSFEAVFKDTKTDILCIQEALAGQVDFFGDILTGFDHVAVGREDGKRAGEHCGIFYSSRFVLEKEGTFWLSDKPEKPSKDWGELFPRICTWVQLQDVDSGVSFRVYNLHMPLNFYARNKSARLVIKRAGKSELPTIIAGDFNTTPDSKAIKIFHDAGFTTADSRGALTFHFKGKGIECLDYILHDKNFTVVEGRIIKDKGAEVYPSDHFGISATLEIAKQGNK